MPKATFYRLELTKKRQLFRALKKEFEYKSFADASINEIIKTAGIARGSFYQYFEDKLDCYLYFVEKLQKKRNQLFVKLLIQERGDLFAGARLFFEQSLVDVLTGPNAQYYQIMIEAHDYRLYQQQQREKCAQQRALAKALYAVTTMKNLKLAGYEEFNALLELICSIFFRTMRHYFRAQQANKTITLAQLKQQCFLQLDWLENGVSSNMYFLEKRSD